MPHTVFEEGAVHVRLRLEFLLILLSTMETDCPNVTNECSLLSCLPKQARHILDRFCFGLRLLKAPN